MQRHQSKKDCWRHCLFDSFSYTPSALLYYAAWPTSLHSSLWWAASLAFSVLGPHRMSTLVKLGSSLSCWNECSHTNWYHRLRSTGLSQYIAVCPWGSMHHCNCRAPTYLERTSLSCVTCQHNIYLICEPTPNICRWRASQEANIQENTILVSKINCVWSRMVFEMATVLTDCSPYRQIPSITNSS